MDRIEFADEDKRSFGVVRSTLPENAGLSARAILEKTVASGMNAILFNSIWEISPTLDPGEIAEIGQQASRLGLGLALGLGHLNPALPFRGQQLLAAGDGDMAAGVVRVARLAAAAGISNLMFTVGRIEERFHPTVAWGDQLAGVASLVDRCWRQLRDHGARLVLKTHEEMTSWEILRLVERPGPTALSVALDPVNFLCRMEDPVAATRRLAQHVVQVHVDDAVLRFEGKEMRRYLAPMGDGVIDWRSILDIVPDAAIWIEMHSGQFAMPVFDPEWLRAQPEIVLAEYAALTAMALEFGAGPIHWDQSAPTARFAHACQAVCTSLRTTPAQVG